MTRKQLAAKIKDYEGFREKTYLDSKGNRTIGWGHKLPPKDRTETISRHNAGALFRHDLDDAGAGAVRTLRAKAGHKAAERLIAELAADDVSSRSFVFVDIDFNMGPRTVRGFPGMLAAVRNEDWERAADELLYRNPDATPRVLTPYAKVGDGHRARDNAWRLRTNTEPEHEGRLL